MNTAPAVRRQSIMDSGTGAPPPALPTPSSAPAAASSSGGLPQGNSTSSSSSSSRRPTFLITPATASQYSRRPSVVNYNNSSSVVGVPPMILNSKAYENTYKVTPEKPFSAVAAKRVLREVMDEMLEGQRYDTPDACKQLTRTLADAIKKRVKELGYPRYKIVANVAIGQAGSATLAFASRCVWNDSFDSFAEYIYKNGSLYAVGLVYAFYCD